MHTLFNVPLLVQRTNLRLPSSVAQSREDATSQAKSLTYLLAVLTGMSLVFGTFALLQQIVDTFAVVLELFFGVLWVFVWRRYRRYTAMAHLLTPLTKAEVTQLFTLSDRSDVVRESLRRAMSRRRDLLQMDLMYARMLMVREVRNGEKASDRMPLEQTRGLLAS